MDTKKLRQALDISLDRVAEVMVNLLFENGSVVSGALAKSVQDDNNVVEDQSGKLFGELSMLSYGADVDAGFRFRGTGKLPPEKPIRDWIQRKRVTRPAKFKNEKNWIWAIRMNIGKKNNGRTAQTKPYPFIDESFKKAEPVITKALTEAGLKDVTLSFNRIVPKSKYTLFDEGNPF